VASAFYPVPAADQGVHSTALIDRSAKIGEGASIGPYAIIGAGAEFGRNCRIAAHVVVERSVRIGNRGFGFSLGPADFVDMPQLGRVIVEDRVEVGASSTIDRGAGPDTVIGAGSKIDNLVQIGHNVQIGRGCVVVARAGVAGSTQLGDHVMRDVPARATVSGTPAIPVKEFFALSRSGIGN
jgi:UDP-3-O-[3-hydroxymyristoyl] glucosamine N-acyltransferase